MSPVAVGGSIERQRESSPIDGHLVTSSRSYSNVRTEFQFVFLKCRWYSSDYGPEQKLSNFAEMFKMFSWMKMLKLEINLYWSAALKPKVRHSDNLIITVSIR